MYTNRQLVLIKRYLHERLLHKIVPSSSFLSTVTTITSMGWKEAAQATRASMQVSHYTIKNIEAQIDLELVRDISSQSWMSLCMALHIVQKDEALPKEVRAMLKRKADKLSQGMKKLAKNEHDMMVLDMLGSTW